MTIEMLPSGDYHGYERITFRLNGRDSFLVKPEKPLPGNPTVWRAEFFGAFDAVDVEMLKRGWHVVYHCCRDMYGCDEALEMFREFHDYMVSELGLGEKVVLFGFSRGGLYSVNYAAKYPERVAGLYLDAPVCNISDWPCRFGGKEAQECLDWYHLTPETLADFDKNPIDKAELIRDIPTIIVAGGSDKVVNYSVNGAILKRRLAELGANVVSIVKPECDHHPHSLVDPTPVADFIEKYCL